MPIRKQTISKEWFRSISIVSKSQT